MKPFVHLDAVAAPLDISNIDTDRIVPARFLRNLRANGYGQYLFHDLRFDASGAEIPEFVLNQSSFRKAAILVAAENFGVGSSREGAVWALVDYGIQVVIATSFGDIFFENSFKNGLLTVMLPQAELSRLRDAARTLPGRHSSVDLEAQTLTGPDGGQYRFDIDPFRKQCLLRGQDEIDLTLALETEICAFEQRQRAEIPWLYEDLRQRMIGSP